MFVNEEKMIKVNIDKNYFKIMQEFLLEALEKIKKFIKNLFNKNQINEQSNTINEIKILFDSIQGNLYKIEEYNDETFSFDIIYLIADEILNNQDLSDKFNLINVLLNKFCNVFKLKNKISDEDYKIKLNDLEDELLEFQHIFFINFVIPSENYDIETIAEINNILLNRGD